MEKTFAELQAELDELCRETRRICGEPEPKTIWEIEAELQESIAETQRLALLD